MGRCCSNPVTQIVPDTEEMVVRHNGYMDRDGEDYITTMSHNNYASNSSPGCNKLICHSDFSIKSMHSPSVHSNTTVSPDIPRYSPLSETISEHRARKQREGLMDDFLQAIKQGNDTMVMYLHDEHPNVDFKDLKYQDGTSALEKAVQNKCYAVIEYMLESGISPNEQNKSGDCPMHLAVRNGDLRTVQLLKQFDADPNIKNDDDETAFTIAQELHHDKILKLLRECVEDDDEVLAKMQQTFNPNQKRETGTRGTTIRVKFAVDNILTSEDDFDGERNVHYVSNLNTDRLEGIADDIFIDITDSIRESKKQLMPLEGWLHHKQHSPPYSWLRRWCLVRDGYFLYSERQISVEGKLNKKERKRWSHCIKLVKIMEVEKITVGKTQRKFRMILYGNKEYVWKCQNQKWRNKWVEQLQHRVKLMKRESALATPKNMV